jgi:hypothetical protein
MDLLRVAMSGAETVRTTVATRSGMTDPDASAVACNDRLFPRVTVTGDELREVPCDDDPLHPPITSKRRHRPRVTASALQTFMIPPYPCIALG